SSWSIIEAIPAGVNLGCARLCDCAHLSGLWLSLHVALYVSRCLLHLARSSEDMPSESSDSSSSSDSSIEQQKNKKRSNKKLENDNRSKRNNIQYSGRKYSRRGLKNLDRERATKTKSMKRKKTIIIYLYG